MKESTISDYAGRLARPGTVTCQLGLVVTLVVLEILGMFTPMPFLLPEYGPGPIPLSREADLWGTGQCSGG